jgi:hypothetical protein
VVGQNSQASRHAKTHFPRRNCSDTPHRVDHPVPTLPPLNSVDSRARTGDNGLTNGSVCPVEVAESEINVDRRVGIACYSAGSGVRVPDGALFPQVTGPANDLQAPAMILSADLTAAMTSTRQSVMASSNPRSSCRRMRTTRSGRMTFRLNTFRFMPVHGSWRRPTTSTADLPDHLTPSQGVAPASGSLISPP